jgi:hypothetical protein
MLPGGTSPVHVYPSQAPCHSIHSSGTLRVMYGPPLNRGDVFNPEAEAHIGINANSDGLDNNICVRLNSDRTFSVNQGPCHEEQTATNAPWQMPSNPSWMNQD